MRSPHFLYPLVGANRYRRNDWFRGDRISTVVTQPVKPGSLPTLNATIWALVHSILSHVIFLRRRRYRSSGDQAKLHATYIRVEIRRGILPLAVARAFRQSLLYLVRNGDFRIEGRKRLLSRIGSLRMFSHHILVFHQRGGMPVQKCVGGFVLYADLLSIA